MPTIAVPNYSAVAHASGGASIDAQAAGAPFGALAQAGGQIANSGQLLGQIAMQRQEHVNAGILANEDTIRRNTYAEVQEYAAKNQGTPETWDAFAKQKFQDYKDGVTARSQTDGWGPDVKERDSLEAKQFFSRADIMFDAERSKALVRQSNGRLEANAESFVRSGDTKKAAEVIDTMNISPEDKAAKKAQVINNGFYFTAQTTLSAMRDLPPAKQNQAVDEFVKNITAKGEDGKFKEFDSDEGGLSLAARRQLIDTAFSRSHQASVDMNQNAKGVVQRVKNGAGVDETVSDYLAKGLIDEETARAFSPDIFDAKDTYDEKTAAKAEIKANRIETAKDLRLSRQDRALTSTLTGIQKKAPTITEQDIDTAEALGITRPLDTRGLSEAGAKQAREELRARTATELADPTGAYALIDAKMDKLKGGAFLGFLPGVEYDKSQQTVPEQTKLLSLISASNLTTSNRLKLMSKFFEVRQSDLADNEINSKVGDRELTPEETDLRQHVTKQFQDMAKDFRSAQTVGQLYFKQSEEIEAWFTKNEGASPQLRQAQAKTFMEKYTREISSAVAGEQLMDVIQ